MAHTLQLYEHADSLVDKVVDFVEGPGDGAPAVLIMKPAHVAALRGRLDGRGRTRILDADSLLEAFMVDGMPDEERFGRALGDVLAEASAPGRTTRAFGEMVALLWERGQPEAAIRLEELWNRLLEGRRVDLLCAYSLGSFAGSEQATAFLRICSAHDHTAPAETHGEDEGLYVARLQQEALSLDTALTRATALQERLHAREREFRDFCENAAEPLHSVGPDGTILWANRAELDLLGYPRAEYIGHNMAEFHEDQDALEEVLRRLRNGETVREHPVTMRTRDGSLRHFTVSSTAHFQDGEMASTRCSMRDVTDSVLLQRERQERLEEMAESNRRKDEFLAMLAHELRNPLTPIHHALQIAQRRRRDPDALDTALGIMRRQLGHMVRLVDDLLDVTRITQGTIELRRQRAELTSIVHESVQSARLHAGDRTIEASVPAGPIHLHGDPTRLHQVVDNLLNNACKFTRTDGHVHVALTVEDGDAVLRFRDDGIGIPQDQLERIFGLFVQGGASPERLHGGLGIGLTLVRTLTGLHGGTVEAHSPGVGQGSEFLVRIPVLAEAGQGGGVARRVLVVHDPRDETLARTLREHGCDVHAAPDGPGAVEAADRLRPDAVVLDLGLPGLDGHEVARRMRRQPWGRHMTLLAWSQQDRDPGRSTEAGFDAHLVKSSDPGRLLRALAGEREVAAG